MEKVAEQLGEDFEVDEAEIPFGYEYIWDWFMDLHQSRSGGGFGPSPIQYQEIEGWSKLKNTYIRDWEVNIIKAMDESYMKYSASEIAKNTKKRK